MPEDFLEAPDNIRDFHRLSASAGADTDLVRGMVEQALHTYVQELTERVHSLPNGGEPASLATILPWLAEFIRETTFEAIRFGVSLQASGGAQAFGPARDQDTGRVPASAARPSAASLHTTPEPSPYATGVASAAVVPSAPSPVPGAAVASDPNTGAATPWLSGGQVTLLVSPFRHFGDVQRFLEDLAKVPLIYDIKPRRFTAGRLYVILGTEYPDAKALADRLETELAPYRPTTRSVQSDLIELLLAPQTSAVSEAVPSS